MEQLPAVVYIDTYEETPITLSISRQIEKLTGYRPEEWIADPELWIRVIHPDDGASHAARLADSSSAAQTKRRANTDSCIGMVTSCGSATWLGSCAPSTARRCSGKA